jgi:MFS family permease
VKDVRYSKEAKKFRMLFLTGAAGLSFFNNMYGVGAIFMTSFLLYMNADATHIGLLAALPNLTALLQIFSIMLYRRFKSRKKVIIALKVIEYLFFYLIIIIPKAVTGSYQMLLIILCYFIGYTFRSLAGGGVIEWNNFFVPSEIKGRYFSNINLLANAAYIIISLTVGKVLDAYDRNYTAYVILFLITMLFTAIEIYSYTAVDDYNEDLHERQKIRIRELITIPFKNEVYRSYVIFALLWNFARSLAAPYYTYYSKAVLNFDYTYIALIGSITCLLKIFAANTWGSAGDKKGWRRVFLFAGHMFALTNVLWALINPQTAILYPFVMVLNGLFMIGINIAIFNLNFNLSPDKDRLIYFGFNAAVVGVFAFIGPNLAGAVVKSLENVNMPLWGFDINGYQVIFLLSGILQIAVIQYFAVYLKKRKLGETFYD